MSWRLSCQYLRKRVLSNHSLFFDPPHFAQKARTKKFSNLRIIKYVFSFTGGGWRKLMKGSKVLIFVFQLGTNLFYLQPSSIFRFNFIHRDIEMSFCITHSA